MRFCLASRSSAAGFFMLLTGVCFLMLMLTSLGQAESSTCISGTVTDSSSLPISGAHIRLFETPYGAVSNREGKYQIPNIKPGCYTVNVTHIGYINSIQSNVIVYQDLPAEENFTLSPALLTNPVVTVKAPRQELSIGFDQQVILNRNSWQYKGVRKVGDVLREIPGVQVLEGDGSQRISLRGSPTRTVKVDLDGIPLNDAGTGEAELGQIDIGQLSSIQVEFEGIGGRVHLLTDDFLFTSENNNSLHASTSYGAYNKSEFNGRYNRNSERLSGGLLFTSKSSKNDFGYELDDGTALKRINNQINTSGSTGRLVYKLNDWQALSSAYWEDSRRGIPGLLYSPPTPDASLRSDRLSGRIGCKGSIGFVKCQLNGYISDYTSHYSSPREQYNPQTGSIVYHFPEDNKQYGLRYGISSGTELQLNRGKLLLEYLYQHDSYKGEDLLRDRVTISAVGLGYADRTSNRIDLKWQYWKQLSSVRLHFSSGLNVEYLKDEGSNGYSAISPHINTVLEKELRFCTLGINTGWGASLSAPPFNALFLVENTFAVGNKDIKPERGDSFTSGINLTSNNPQSDTYWRFDLSAFHSVIEDLIVWQRNFQNKYYPDNMDRVKSLGIEINNKTVLWNGVISLNSNYIYNHSVNDIPDDINYGNQIPLTVKHSGTASISIKRAVTTLHLTSRWVGRRYSTEANHDPNSTAGRGLAPYAVYNIHLSRAFKPGRLLLTCEGGIDNIFNESYRIIERSPMPGRTYNVRISMRI